MINANNWVSPGAGEDWAFAPGNTNTALLLDPNQSLMAEYVKSADVYKCPSDTQEAQNGPRDRSYSMNAATGGKVGTIGATPGYTAEDPANPRTYIQDTSAKPLNTTSLLNKPGPVKVWVILDEHPDDLVGAGGDAIFQFRPGYPPTQYQWQDMPSSLHNGACGISFADGHSEIHKWLDGRTKWPVHKIYKWWQGSASTEMCNQSGPTPASQDYAWMNAGMPYQ